MAPGRPIVIFGAGGQGRECAVLLGDIEKAHPGSWDLRGFVAEWSPDQDAVAALGVEFLGAPEAAALDLPDDVGFVVALGGSADRRNVTDRLVALGWHPVTLVHPSAWIGDGVILGEGSVVCAGSILTTNISFGAGAQINVACTVSHDVVAGDFVTLSPAVSLSGRVRIGDLSTVYTRAAVNPGVQIGTGAVVGAGAVVATDVADGVTVVGVPARPLPPRRSGS